VPAGSVKVFPVALFTQESNRESNMAAVFARMLARSGGISSALYAEAVLLSDTRAKSDIAIATRGFRSFILIAAINPGFILTILS
jgi:nicotinamide mononucleotide (NMN) deamidase PncC